VIDWKSGKNNRPTGSFPWRQGLVAASVFAVLITGFGWFDAGPVAVSPGVHAWLLAATALASAALGFVIVACEWLAKRLMRRLGVSSAAEVELRSRF
jgi:hypothetical protein